MKLDLEKLQQDVWVHPFSSQKARADRLGVARETIRDGLKKIGTLSVSTGEDLGRRINSWLNNLPQEEHEGGRQLYSRIIQSHQERSQILDLSNLGLCSLPMGILSQLSWLRILNLSDNLLTTLAGSGIAGLEKLQHLDLSKNLFTTLAGSDITRMGRLRHLDLSNNLLTSAEELYGLYWLPMLKLDGNPSLVDRIPLQKFFGRKQRGPSYHLLKKIDVSRRVLRRRTNRWLNRLPLREYLGGRSLCSRVMQVYGGKSFKKGKTLRLNLPKLSLSSLPTGVLGQLDWLRSLDLSGNFLNTLVGTGISELGQLQHLDLSDNLLTDLKGSELTELRKLQILNLSSNLLTNVEELGEMYWLQTLNLANNPTLIDRRPLQNFPESTLNLSSIDVTELSLQIQSASELKLLEISSEELDYLNVVESRTTICRPAKIALPCGNSHNLLPGTSGAP